MTAQLAALLAEFQPRGRMLHDASIVATMLTQGIGALLTNNPADFQRYAARIQIVAL